MNLTEQCVYLVAHRAVPLQGYSIQASQIQMKISQVPIHKVKEWLIIQVI